MNTTIRYAVFGMVVFLVLVVVGSTSELERLLSDAVAASSGTSLHFPAHVVYQLFTTLIGSLVQPDLRLGG